VRVAARPCTSENRQHAPGRARHHQAMSTQVFHLERVPTPIGLLLLVTDAEDRVRALDWDDQATRLHWLLRRHYGPADAILREGRTPSDALRALAAYFAGDLSAIDRLHIETGGTAFQRAVWRALRRIPAGQTTTYGVLAAGLERPTAARAVGLASGANPIGIVVPCHRVIGANGSLTGYGGGLDRKRWLLAHEKCNGRLCIADV
jgi:methylated-DNA-[protein]-cysteine S-methyltransferase